MAVVVFLPPGMDSIAFHCLNFFPVEIYFVGMSVLRPFGA
jgi:hypothetical protein